MEIIFSLELDEFHNPGNNITYLYKIREGIVQSSFGIYCAKMCGIKHSIIKRAEQLLDIIEKGEDPVIACSTLTES
ncbi:uncharacterized protein ASCRUDRAFT_78379, partial [Ascoidea rubescens DSM 1968]